MPTIKRALQYVVPTVALSAAIIMAVIFFTNGTQTSNVSSLSGQTQTAAVAQTFTYPQLRDPQGLDDPSLAFGYSGGCYYCTGMPYLNIIEFGRSWQGDARSNNRKDDWREQPFIDGGYLDEDGWLKSIPPELNSARLNWVLGWSQREDDFGIMDTFDRDRILGDYRFTYEGEGTFEFINWKPVEEREGYIILRLENARQNVGIRIMETDPNGTGNYLRNFVLVHEDNIDLYESGARFNPDSFELYKDARLLRWLTANNNPRRDMVNEVNNPDWYKVNDSPIAFIEMANQSGSDAWFTLPFHATDEYIIEFAEIVKERLDPELVAHFELSNEVWNWAFRQAQDANREGEVYFGTGEGRTWLNYYAVKSVNAMQLITDVYGPNEMDRVKRVVGTQVVSSVVPEQVLTAPVWKKHRPDTYVEPHTVFDAIAGTSYYGSKVISKDVSRDALIEAVLDPNVDNNDFIKKLLLGQIDGKGLNNRNYMQQTKDALVRTKEVADQYGVDIILYEGGQHVHHSFSAPISGDELAVVQDALIEFVRSPENRDLYQMLWDFWEEIGDGPFMQFTLIGEPGRFGSWGLYAHLDDTNLRADLLNKLNANTPAWWENRAGEHFQHGYHLSGTNRGETIAGSNQEDFFVMKGGDDVIYPGPKDDGVNGGDGIDTVLFLGNRNQYTITPAVGRAGYQIAGPDGKDFVNNVERLQFSDQTVTVENMQVDPTPTPDPEPEPDPEPNPTPDPEPNPDPTPDPDPNPGTGGGSTDAGNTDQTKVTQTDNYTVRIDKESNTCAITSFELKSENRVKRDNNHSFPVGLFDTKLDCDRNGEVVVHEIVLDGSIDTSDWIMVRYDKKSKRYFRLSKNAYEYTKRDGNTVIQFNAKDGGKHDVDRNEDGELWTVVGPAVPDGSTSSGSTDSGNSSSNSGTTDTSKVQTLGDYTVRIDKQDNTCRITRVLAKTERQIKQDADSSFPFGLFEVNMRCPNAGETVIQEIVFDGNPDTSDWIMARYDKEREGYMRITKNRYNYSQRGGNLVIEYTVKDGSREDENDTDAVIQTLFGPAVKD